ncbi:MAG TPA: Gfo/Idh/MocA family oxidoreductase [Tepidisphaeraceae bacterium]|nr:Gfo/Idh/MocA family oxidoreductase [Tepidisphaeraceae bacterium]
MAVVGLGGYAGSMAELLTAYTKQAGATVSFVAACDPNLAQHAERVQRLRDQGVKVLDRFEDVLNEPIDAVWLPLPIQLHRPFTEQALAAGKAVLCEKPAAGSLQDVDAMIAASERANRPVAIGFQDVYDPTMLQLKRRLLDGLIGDITATRLMACWPRDNSYYARSGWAGRVKVEDAWVLDSPANNALAHPVNLALYLLGDESHRWAELRSVEAELYRAYPIENFDTCSIRVATGKGPLLTQFTHACRRQIHPVIHIEGTAGRVAVELFGAVHITTANGTETVPRSSNNRFDMVRNFANWVQGRPCDCTVTSVRDARAHAMVINGAAEATAVRDVAGPYVEHGQMPTAGVGRWITGIEDAITHANEHGQMLHESKQAPWTAAPGTLSLQGYSSFTGPPPTMR